MQSKSSTGMKGNLYPNVIFREQLEEDDEMALQSEVDILSRIDHPNVVKLVEIFDTDECLYLVLEIMTGGEV